MRTNFGFVALVCLISFLSGLLQASEYPVPHSWELIAQSQGADITDFAIKGNWIVWFEKELDPKTAGFRAESFFMRLYRKNLDSNRIETLYAPEGSQTWGEHFVLGPEGITSYGYRGRNNPTLYIPGQSEPVLLPSNSYAEFSDIPFKIYKKSLLCQKTNGSKVGISVIPFDGNTPDLDNKITIIEPNNINDTDYREDKFWNGRQLLYTKKTSSDIRRNYLELYDINKKEILWSINNDNVKALGLSDNSAYYLRFTEKIELIRRSTGKYNKIEKMVSSLFSFSVIDFCPERLLSIFTENDKLFIGEIDLNSGQLSKYDFSLPVRQYYPARNIPCIFKITENAQDLMVTGDAETGELIVLLNNNIYKVPKVQSNKIDGLAWKSATEENVK